MLEALQGSWLGHAIGESQMLTASLSALHLVGFTLVMGSATISNLRMLGVALADLPSAVVTRPASRTLATGLALSAITGALLFVPRASGAAANPTFRLKLSLLVIAAVLHFTVQQHVATRPIRSHIAERIVGSAGLILWLGVALAGCAFILLE